MSEASIGKATKGDVVVLYFEPLATQDLEASGPTRGWNLMIKKGYHLHNPIDSLIIS